MQAIILIILLAFLVVIWRTKPAEADVTITAIRYTLDDVTWIGLDGATLEPGYINVAVMWRNNSSESVDTLMTLVVEDQGQEPDQEYVTVAPNEEVTSALLMEFIEGSRKVTAIIYKEDDMARLASITVNVSVVAPPPPVCTIGETKCEGFNLYRCQLVGVNPDWVFVESNSQVCGYVPPAPTASATIDIKAQVNSAFVDLEELEIKAGDTVILAVIWKNTTPNAGITATTSLVGTRPDGGTANITLVGTNTRTVGVDGSAYVKYSLLFDAAGTWSFEAVLDGDVSG